MKIAGPINNILPKLNVEIDRRTIEYPKKKISGKAKRILIIFVSFFIIEGFIVLLSAIKPEIARNNFIVMLLFFIPFSILFLLTFAMFYYESANSLKNIKISVNYNILKLVLEELNKRNPELEVEVEIYDDFKKKKIINEFLSNAKTVKIFGKEFLRLPKKVEAELKIKKWQIIFPDNKVLSLKHKLRINSRRFKSSSGKIRNEVKVVNKVVSRIKKDDNILGQYSAKVKTKFPNERVPVVDLREYYKKEKLLAIINNI